MSNNTSHSSGGIGFAGVLTIVFIVLKLVHEITWSWWWVLSPLWISAALGVAVIAIVIVFGAVAGAFGSRGARRYR
jgi:hypothetical protein